MAVFFLIRILLIFLFFLLITVVAAYSSETRRPLTERDLFDPNDCYEAGTIFEENEKNLGFCPCKYGYFGPLCFEIYDCAIGELRTDSCDRDFGNDYDLQWRCAASKKDVVKICTCPEGFRGETCEFILENTFATYWETAKQSQRFFEIVYNRSHSVARLAAAAASRKILEHRRLLMVIIFFIVFQMAWIRVRRDKNNDKKKCKNPNCRSNNRNSKEQIDKIPCIPNKEPFLSNNIMTEIEELNWKSKNGSEEIWIPIDEESKLVPLIDYDMLERMESQESREHLLRNSCSSASSVRSEGRENEEKEATEVPTNNDFRVHKPCLHI